MPVFVRILKNEYPDLNDISRMLHDYEVTKKINSTGIVQPVSCDKFENSYALVFKDEGCVSLKLLLKEKKFTIEITDKKLRDIRIHDIGNQTIIIRKPGRPSPQETWLHHSGFFCCFFSSSFNMGA